MGSRSICVYCGSRVGDRAAYVEQATALGQAIADNGWRLVYGAGDIGLMGTVARAAQRAGAENMHERKKVMFMNADAIVVMPGGAGSMDEFFEVLTWAQLGLHDKPIVLMNVEGYWDPLIALMDHVINSGFADPSLRDLFAVEADSAGVVAHLNARI